MDKNVAVPGTNFGIYHTELYSQMSDVDKIIVWGRKIDTLKELQNKFRFVVTDYMKMIQGWSYSKMKILIIADCSDLI